ncbi:hypothetical protein CRUP_027907 [Coryphaenoides rupestris]|nr:hypothetical protein CRUP_027907 [Coryphaenoides rupestris]
MSDRTPDERLRLEQITQLRRRWLKDQELSPREPVLKPQAPGATYKAYTGGVFALTRLLIPAWIVHYCVKYHMMGDTILETGEVIPDLPETHGHH